MGERYEKTMTAESSQERCDIKTWSGECRQSDSSSGENKYLCAVCGTLVDMNHEVHHEHFPHVSGDSGNLY